MAEATEAADVELQMLLAEIKSIDARKRALVGHASTLEDLRLVGFGQDNEFDEEGASAGLAVAVEVRLEELNEQIEILEITGQDEQLELDAYTERSQHQLAILSNILKKCSDTAAAIVANLK